MQHGRSTSRPTFASSIRRVLAVLFLALAAVSWTSTPAQASNTICQATGGGDKLCKTYGLYRCSGGACRQWVNRCELKRSGAFSCDYEATETRCSGGCNTTKTVCFSTSRSASCVTTDPDTCRASGSGFRTCSSSTNSCKSYGRFYRCVFAQQYTSCRRGSCKEVKKTCRSGSNLPSRCTPSVRRFKTTKPATTTTTEDSTVDGVSEDPVGDGDGTTSDTTGVAVATGACPDPNTYIGTPDQVPPGYYDGCPGISR